MSTKLISTAIFFLLLLATSNGTHAQQIRNSYLLYNQARVCEAQGKPDSAALLMLQSIRLNDQDMAVREYAWKTWLNTGRYNDWLHDLQRYYQKNTMPESVDELFKSYDSAVVAKVKSDKSVKQFVWDYEHLKKSNRAVVVDRAFKQLLETCFAIDQFARNLSRADGVDDRMRDKLIFSADSINTAAIGDYILKKGMPSEAEQDMSISWAGYSILALHILRDSIGMSQCPGWQVFDSAFRANALAGKCSPKWYVFILDQRHRLKCRASKLTETQRYGALKCPDWDSVTQKQIYVYQFEIEDIEQVDERRAQWYLPTLLQESIIDPELVLPKNYRPR